MIENKRIFFNLPGEITLREVVDEILRNNSLETNRRTTEGGESKVAIIRDAARILFQRKVPQEKLAEFLTSHLGTSPETAQKIIGEINQKLIPFAKFVEERDETPNPSAIQEKGNTAQKVILEKIKGKSVPPPPRPKKPLPAGVKEPTTANVEENAKLMEKKKEEPPPQEPPQPAQDDKYREIIE